MTTEPTGRYETHGGQNILALSRTFHAPITDVWKWITEPQRLARWIGTWDGDPATGSIQFHMTAEGEDSPPVAVSIEACEPPHLLRVTMDAAWVLRLELTEPGDVTTLAFSQVIDDPSALENVGPGWDFYLDRLVAAESQQDVSAIDFDRDYYPALSGYYASLAADRE